MITQSKEIDQIAKALAEFQAKPIIIGKDTAAYKYKYATLDKCVEIMFPVLSGLGLSVLQPLTQVDGEPAIATIIMHTSGQYISTVFPLEKAGMSGVNMAQDFGAAISYARRYGLLSAFGVPTGEDTDAQTTSPKKRQSAGRKYKKSDPTPAEEIIDLAIACESVEELSALFNKHGQTIRESPKKDKILSEFSLRKGQLEERSRRSQS